MVRLEGTGIPFSPITRPEDLFDDPHLLASGGLEPVTMPNGRKTALPTLPIEMDGKRTRRAAVLGAPPQLANRD